MPGGKTKYDLLNECLRINSLKARDELIRALWEAHDAEKTFNNLCRPVLSDYDYYFRDLELTVLHLYILELELDNQSPPSQ
jgi:hypothetical protein